MKKRLLTVAIALFVGLLSVEASGFARFERLTTNDGLSSLCVGPIYQDEFGMVWVATNDGLNRYNGRSISVYRPILGDSTSLYNNNIRAVCGNRNGKVWVINKYALSEFDMATEKFHTIRKKGVRTICCENNTLWVAGFRQIWRLDEQGTLQTFYELPQGVKVNAMKVLSDGRLALGTEAHGVIFIDSNRKITSTLGGQNISYIFEDSKHRMWFSTRYNGIYCYGQDASVVNYVATQDENSLPDNFVRSVCEDDLGHIWVGTFKGLCEINPETRSVRRVDDEEGSLRSTSVWYTYCDANGLVWIGTYHGGVFIYNRELDRYKHHDIFGSIVEDNAGNLWLGSEDSPLVKYNPRTDRVQRVHERKFMDEGITSLYFDLQENELWVGTLRGGLVRLSSDGRILQQFRHSDTNPRSLPNNHAREIIPFGTDSLIVAHHTGLMVFNKRTGECREVEVLSRVGGGHVSDVLLDSNGDCWASVSAGVVRYNLATGESRQYLVETSIPEMGSAHVQKLFEDGDGNIWLGSSGAGLFLFEPQTDSFVCINGKNSALPSDYIIDIAQTESGYLLIATMGGLVKYDHDNNIFYTYNRNSGYPLPEAATYGIFIASDNVVYLSGHRHMVSFHEQDLVRRKAPHNIWFVNLRVDNMPVAPGDQSGILSQSLFYQNKIRLDRGHSMWSVECTTLGSVPDAISRLEYKLEGYDEDWIIGDWGKPISYTNLPGRDYVLKVRRIHNQSSEVLAEKSLKVEVVPPFYATWWFVLLLLAVVLTLAVVYFKFYSSRVKLHASLEWEKLEKKKIQELNENKLQFFTYVSHEIRTPVTLINSQLESILAQQGVPPSVYRKVSSMHDNLQKVYNLINELLDFKKRERMIESMRFCNGDIITMLEKTATSFREYAVQRKVKFEFLNQTDVLSLKVWYDAVQMDKVLNNLLSNAFKHTPEGGKIKLILSQTEQSVLISVKDTGDGIDPEYQKAIFEPFSQVPGDSAAALGTGLGLAITQGIVQAHGGTIALESEKGKGAKFVITLPKGDSHIAEEQKCEVADEDNQTIEANRLMDKQFVEDIVRSQEEAGSRGAKMLIVEDNNELRQYLTELFDPFYKVTSACDGEDALQKLEYYTPDIIVSDLMMPNVDGVELCRRVKNNVETSHIRFVMLTAKVTVEAELEGFRSGADDYIAKPFNSKILVTKCNALVNSRLQQQRSFMYSMDSEELAGNNTIDKTFLDSAMKIMNEHISDASFDIGEFAREMAMGRTSFFMKLKGITGQTPNKFMTNVRLKKSLDIMRSDPALSVGEVSYMVGFSSPSYFIKLFKELFGETPASFKKNLGHSEQEG
ncbi:MAG: response regulator [Tidjanibacter sp.]|nr:response regulator [Tidjanibacter sp.]